MITITGIKEYTGTLKYKSKWDYKNGLPPLDKPKLGKEYKFESDEIILKTNIDGFPYIIEDAWLEWLGKKDKISIEGEQGMYTVTHIDYDTGVLEAKMDKVLNLTERTVREVVDYYNGWGMKKETEKVKANYVWDLGYGLGGYELAVEGKLSKNQVVQLYDLIIKITELNKNEDGLIEISGDSIDRWEVQPVFPYKENGKVVGWYENLQSVYVRQGREYVNKLENLSNRTYTGTVKNGVSFGFLK